MPIAFDNSYARLPGRFYAKLNPDPAPRPGLIRLNHALALKIGLDVDWLASADGIAMLSGAAVAEGSEPLAMAYAGHQFGGWSHQLGDGRAHLLGEVMGPDGIRRDIQLKGSGRTPFSRMGDGKSALGPVLREYLISEFMAAAGVPTTRALAATLTGVRVQRETSQPGAVLVRVAESHVRVGTFQYFHAREDADGVRTLADYVIDRHDPDIRQVEGRYRILLDTIVERQAQLVAQWMGLGFIHGVMNTDNMQIAGETIDYGPCAFMDAFHPGAVFSSIDHGGRYAWSNQPGIAAWNLSRLAETFLPLLHEDADKAVKIARDSVGRFSHVFNAALNDLYRRKFGIAEDPQFVQATFRAMTDCGVDYTLLFSGLTRIALGGDDALVVDLFHDADRGKNWLAAWREKHDREKAHTMITVNPIFIPRNHRVDHALKSANDGNYKAFEELLEVLANPYDAREQFEKYEAPPKPEEIVHQTFCGT
ncbi:MAG: YdiU family protein [Rhodobacteraceae bacterium]|nr:YdiU family protein [Paracoccaceae bacterium]